ncbi:expressed unknown protein [Seminavis robusta]|uniref:Uncharacterized protein n=1 Tax=Seminavis robusta TaxID=568900 RepID=A0A9N8HP25_9STRA|nr:expressed unknown protein [Seminavis robusta]|eukprot:Sro1282_g258970.1 n/a (302) ;mRNA; r:5846-6751
MMFRSFSIVAAAILLSNSMEDVSAFTPTRGSRLSSSSSLFLADTAAAVLEKEVVAPLEETTTTATKKSENQITHLQKKLRYWKQEQKKKETEYKSYQLQKTVEHHTKPIYRREGKIDHYSMRPVYDQQTERIQTEVWSIKEQIKVTQAMLHEERRVESVKKEVDDEIQSLKAQQEELRQQAALQLQSMQEESTARLTEKEQQIAAVKKDIQQLSQVLNDNRNELQNKEICLDSLEKELHQKEAILHHLSRERASIRALVKQSWRVLKNRFKKHILHKELELEQQEQPETEQVLVAAGEANN